MKRIFSLALALLLLFSLCACNDKGIAVAGKNEEKPISELTFYPEIGVTGNYFVYDGLMYTHAVTGLCCYNEMGELLWQKSLKAVALNPDMDGGNWLYDVDNGVSYLYYENGKYYLEAFKNDGTDLWKIDLSQWGEVRGAVSDNEKGVIVSINRSVFEGGGIIALHFNSKGELSDLDNMVADDKNYVDRGSRALAFNSKTKDLFSVFRVDDHIDNPNVTICKVNLENGKYSEINSDGNYWNLVADENTNTFFAYSGNGLGVYNNNLELIRTHSYEYIWNVFPIKDGYMVYHSGEGFHEGHTIDIYASNGSLRKQIDIGYKGQVRAFEEGFIASTEYLGMGDIFRYDYNGNLLNHYEIDTDDTCCHIYDINTVFCDT